MSSCHLFFYAFYSVVKGFIGPLFLYKMGVFLSRAGDHVIPRWILGLLDYCCIISKFGQYTLDFKSLG